LAEVRTVAVAQQFHKQGIGHLILNEIIRRAREVGVKRIFCLTFQTEFFGSIGFVEIEGTPVEPEVYAQLLRSYDAGVAEFLDLESVKPNTLGNTRMLLTL
jgi:amino-acid N-acetyltransferase